MALLVLSCSMTAPALMAPLFCCGSTRFTYRSPNNVLGSRRALTLPGISFTLSGNRASSSSAPFPLDLMAFTDPTISPRTLTSLAVCSWLPMWSVLSVTFT